MRSLSILVAILCLGISQASASLVTVTSQRDTLAIPFSVFDSAGSDIALASGDSVYLTVFSPGGAIVYKDSMSYNAAAIVVSSWEDYNGAPHYALVKQALTLIGGSSSRGVYSFAITVDDNTNADLTTKTSGFFQVVNAALESSLDSAASTVALAETALDSLDAVSLRLLDIADSINSLINTPASAVISTEDKQHIAGYVDDTLSAKHGEGSWAASTIGAGAYSTTLLAYDSAATQSINGVAVSVYNLAQTSLKAVVSSDLDGLATVNLDPDTHIVVATAPGYRFNTFDTVVITGSQIDTLFATHFHPGFASLPELCRVWGYVYDLNGNAVVGGEVSAYLPTGVARVQSVILAPTGVTTSTDANGYFYLDLFPSALLVPAGTMYELSITMENGAILRRRVAIPQQATWQITW